MPVRYPSPAALGPAISAMLALRVLSLAARAVRAVRAVRAAARPAALAVLALLTAPWSALAQTPAAAPPPAAAVSPPAQPPTEFPPGAVRLVAAALRERLAGKTFDSRVHDGSTSRIEYRGNGYAFLDTDRGFRDDGPWSAEGDEVCIAYKRRGRLCSPVYALGDRLYVRRNGDRNGEVVTLIPR